MERKILWRYSIMHIFNYMEMFFVQRINNFVTTK